MPRKDRLSPMDASFIFIDSEVVSNIEAALAICEGEVSLEQMMETAWEKINRTPRAMQTPMKVPFNLAHPTWEYVDIDLKYHVREERLEAPGTDEQLMDICGRLFEERLDPNRPQWRIHIIRGLQGGRSATLGIVHHCLADGLGAANLIATIFDTEPFPKPPGGPVVEPEPVPGPMRRLWYAIADNAKVLSRRIPRIPAFIVGLYRVLQKPRVKKGFKAFKEFREAPCLRFPYNAVLSGKLKFRWTALPLHEMEAIGKLCSATTNDVLLTAIVGAGERYAHLHGLDTTDKFFKMQVPVSIRRKNQYHELGNIVAMTYTMAPYGINDPITRLKTIQQHTNRMRALRVWKGLAFAVKMAQTIMTPPGVAIGGKIFSSIWFQRHIQRRGKPPIFNLQVTNVPWRHRPLYSGGRQVVRMFPMLHLLPSIGMTCCAVSYNGYLHVTFTGDRESAADVDKYVEYLDEAFEELRTAAGIGIADEKEAALEASG